MKKMIVLSIALVCSGFAYGAQDSQAQLQALEVAQKLAEARVIRYSITVYCDPKKFDAQVWGKTVNNAVQTVELGKASEGVSAEFIDSIIRALQAMKTRSHEDLGVHIELIKVGVGDGKCPANRCGLECACIKKYNGVCPCSAITDESCCGKK